MGKRRSPLKTDFEKNIVYLYQFPRARCAPTLSPFALKLETWLRMADVPYENVDCGFQTRSLKGKIPFVELNGREIADSGIIIGLLSTIFRTQLDKHLYETDLAVSRAFASLVEDHLFWIMLSVRLTHIKDLFGDRGFGPSLPKMVRLLRGVLAWKLGRGIRKALAVQGMGAHSLPEVIEMGKKDLRALSLFLDTKKYLAGLKPCSADATVFGHLVQIWYTPVQTTPLKHFMATECANLVDYMERIKAEYWPDWEEATATLSRHTNWKRE